MTLNFVKMNGAGNDFVLLDNRANQIRLTREQVVRLCDRQRGVGADGLMLLVPCTSGKANWAWDFYNSDGSTAEMCANGARCFARYIERVTGAKERLTFETIAGVISAEFKGERVSIGLTPPHGLRLNEQVPLSGGVQAVHSLNTGVPHAVLFVEDADKAMVQPLGNEIRFHKHFAPKGTNVNFAQVLGPSRLRVRTYERGVEGETLACGTGACAAVVAGIQLGFLESPVAVTTRGGELSIAWDGGQASVTLTGPAVSVFEGTIDI